MPYCSSDSFKSIILFREDSKWIPVSISNTNSSIEYLTISTEEQELICRDCGFTAVLDTLQDTIVYTNYYVDPYALCDHINNITEKEY